MTAYMTAAEERDAVLAAQSGDTAAMTRLVEAQSSALWAEANARRDRFQDNVEDLYQEGAIALMGAVRDMRFLDDKPARLWTFARPRVRKALNEFRAGHGALTIPGRTLQKYESAMRLAGGDVQAARDLAQSREGMDPETFNAVHAAVTLRVRNPQAIDAGSRDEQSVDFSLDELGPDQAALMGSRGEAPYASVEARETARTALSTLDPRAREVIARAAGFLGDPQTDAEIADAMGLTRPTVQRIRTASLSSMRAALND